MLLKRTVLERIESGEVTCTYRRWKRPTVKSGGTLVTQLGQLEIRSVAEVSLSKITASQAKSAGYTNLVALRDELRQRTAGKIWA